METTSSVNDFSYDKQDEPRKPREDDEIDAAKNRQLEPDGERKDNEYENDQHDGEEAL